MIDFHRLMLGDRVRNAAFAEALRQTVRPGMTVSDIGAGTGVLGFLASKLGAKECHLYEVGDIVKIAKKLAVENGITNCRFVQKHSTAVKNPPKTDIVISETLGNYALEENILETLRDAKRFLKPGGVMIPQKLRQFVCPVIADRIHREVTAWDEVGHGLTFNAARDLSINNIYVRRIEPKELLKDGTRAWDQLDFRDENDSVRAAVIEWTLQKDTELFGFAIWWECELMPGVALSTSPSAPPTHWEQIYLPVPHTLSIKKGQQVRLRLHSDSRLDVKIRLRWEAEVVGTAQQWKMDMWNGML